MRWLALVLLMAGCATYPKTQVGIVHDYIFENAKKSCKNHGGLHYIVAVKTLYGGDSDLKSYPCKNIFKIRCQDQALLDFEDGVGYCFISQSQIEESL